MLRLGSCKPPSLLPAALLDSDIRSHLGCLEGWQRGKRQILTHPLLFLPVELKCCPAMEDGSDYRKRDPFQSLRVSSCLTLRNELSKETHVLTKQEILSGKGTRGESSRVRKPRRRSCATWSQSRVYGDGISFWVVFGQSF